MQYILRKLGQPVWNVEVTKQQVLDCIQDAVNFSPSGFPAQGPLSNSLVADPPTWRGVDVGQGVASVSFVEPNPVPTEIFYGNLINPAPLFRTGLDEYDTFLRWRKTWQRVTSIQPDWFYDEAEQALYIHNPIERYLAGVICYFPYRTRRASRPTGARWVKEYALAAARFMQGDLWMKFSGAIPWAGEGHSTGRSKRDELRRSRWTSSWSS
jgi:hypothetical protein